MRFLIPFLAMALIFAGCAQLKRFAEWETVDVVFPWMTDMGAISAVTGQNVTTGQRFNFSQVQLYIGPPLAAVDVDPPGNFAAAWRTDNPKWKYFVAYFSRTNFGPMLVGFTYDLEAEPGLQIRTNAAERVLLENHLKGIRPSYPRCTRSGCGI